MITKKCHWMCASNLLVLVRQFSAWKFYFVIGHSHLSPVGRCELVLLSKDSCFVSRFTYPTSYPWCNECQYAWLLFQRHTAVLRQFFGFPRNNIWQNPCMTLIRNIGQNESLHYLPLFWNFFWSISGIGVLKNINVALFGMKNINLTKESIKILEGRISYNTKIQDDLNFTKTIKNLCNVIKL